MAKTKTFNLMKAKIQIQSELNPDKREKHLHSYRDSQIIKLIRYGLPLHYNYDNTLQSKGIKSPIGC